MARHRLPWPLAVSQWWRWRYPDLWRGRTFDPHTRSRAFAARCGMFFLLTHVQALDYALIARHLGLTAADVQARFAEAMYEISRTIDLIDCARPPSKLSKAEHPDV